MTVQLAHSTQNHVLIITPQIARLNTLVANDFKEGVIDLLSRQEELYVVFDLHQLQFIDSSGLGAFLAILRSLHSRGGEIRLARINRPVQTILEMVSMHKIFSMFPTIEEAVEAF